eukprot:4101384-Amphidinium_carterae.1
MWYKCSGSIAIRSKLGAKRQLGSAKVLCSPWDAYEVAMDGVGLLESNILAPQDVSAYLFQET